MCLEHFFPEKLLAISLWPLSKETKEIDGLIVFVSDFHRYDNAYQ